MRRSIVIALVLVACADTAETIAGAPCLWRHTGDYTLPDWSCWLLQPSVTLAVTEAGANACQAQARGREARVWQPGQRLELWTPPWAPGDELLNAPTAVDCPR